jgi:hypothetical protein
MESDETNTNPTRERLLERSLVDGCSAVDEAGMGRWASKRSRDQRKVPLKMTGPRVAGRGKSGDCGAFLP